MPLGALNLDKFTDCLTRYRRDCSRTLWVKNELPKFYFANLLSRRIQLQVQTAEMILEICQRVEEKNYYYNNLDTRIAGIQFLKGTGNKKFSQPLTMNEIRIFKNLVGKENWCEADFAGRNVSYTALSGWLGTLLPIRFVPVTSTLFRYTISYLFDLELKIYQRDDYDFFAQSQKYFYLTKRKLREVNLESLYLRDIAEYLKFKYPKANPKTKYDEYDLNWLTQDFHLYIFREILRLDWDGEISIFDNLRREGQGHFAGFQTPNISQLYVP
jgi:hypothetical protein